ncbi:MAG: hypothetical protein ACREB5_04120 [Sphingomonadaceae bacterium]
MLRSVAGAAGALFLTGKGFAQGIDPLKVLQGRLPPELLAVPIPAKALDILQLISAILKLERDADVKNLPQSVLAFGVGAKLPTSMEEIYQAALPRLDALIDRVELNDPTMTEQASELLAKLHGSQHVAGDGWQAVANWGPDEGIGPVGVPRPRLAAFAGGKAGAPTSLPTMSTASNFQSLRAEYAKLFGTAQVRPEHAGRVEWHMKAIEKFRPRYEAVSRDTAVPWHFIGVIHCLESSFNFRAHLHNGDFPLTARTRQVPKGRPSIWLPPDDWESSAKDALRLLGFVNETDWSLEKTLYRLERYNGFGYRKRRVATPYLWSFSNHYESGKYVSDGSWSPTSKSQQCGAAMMLKVLTDTSKITFPPAPTI